MRFSDYSGTEQFRPLSAWAYFGYGILFAIPIIGWIFLLIFTFSSKNYNRRSFARSYWCSLFAAVIIVTVLMVTGVGFGWLYKNIPALQQYLPETTTGIRTVQTTATPAAKEPAGAAISPSESSTQNVAQSHVGETPSFKEQMDGYEAFFDSYIKFMESYDSGKSTITQQLKYAEMMTQYADTMDALDHIDESKLSQADEQYMIKVTLRINQKLAAFAAKM